MFKVKITYDKTDLMALFRVSRWPRGRGRWHSIFQKLGLTVGALLTALAIAAGLRACTYEISSVFSGGSYALNAFDGFSIIITAAMGLSLIFPNSDWFWRWAVWKNYKEKGTELEFCFSEDGFTVTVLTCRSDFSYDGIAKLYEDRNSYVLILPGGTGYVLRKSSFVDGDPAIFGPWLSEKTGKQIIQA